MVEPLERRLVLSGGVAVPAVHEPAEGESATQVLFRLETTDLAGTPITTTSPGSDFYLAAWVRDAREVASSPGVYAAFLDVLYDSDLLATVPSLSNPLGFDIQFGEHYQNGMSGLATVAGLIDEAGAFQVGFSPLGAGEFLLFRVRFSTVDVSLHNDVFTGIDEDSGPIELDVLANDQLPQGNALFEGDLADAHPAHDVLLFRPPAVVLPAAQVFLGTALAISTDSGNVITHVSVPSAGGLARISDDGDRLIFTPAPDFSGVATFTYRVGDGDPATVTVVVEPVNDAPLAVNDVYDVGYEETLEVDALHGVLANDHDAEGDVLSAHVVDEPAHGSVVLHADGGFTYVPHEGYRGRDQFTYVAEDGELPSPAASVFVDVGMPRVSIRLEVTDAAGQRVDRLAGSGTVQVRAWVQDVRGDSYAERGVYAAYLDLLYDAQLAQPRLDVMWPRGFEIYFGEEFYEPGSGNASEPGVIDEVGSYSTSFTPLGAGEWLLFDMPMDVRGLRLADDDYEVSLQSRGNVLDVLTNDLTLTWSTEFVAESADVSPDHDVLLYEPVQAVSVDQIVYAGAALELTNEAALTIVAVSATAQGAGVAITADQRRLSYTPPAGFVGTDTFTYTVSDSQGGLAEATVMVQVIPSWQNIRNPLDVNADMHISPIDVLLVISDLNRRGARPLVEPSTGPPFVDVNGDGSVSPIDALLVISHLNRGEGEGEAAEGAGESRPTVADDGVSAGGGGTPLPALSTGASVFTDSRRAGRLASPKRVLSESWQEQRWAEPFVAAGSVDDFFRQWADRGATVRQRWLPDDLLELWDGPT